MRMWMIEPKLMCRKHLLGEHLELHMILESMRKGKKLKGFFDNRIIEPKAIYERHIVITEEMMNRNYRHKTEILYKDFTFVFIKYKSIYHGLDLVTVNRSKSLLDLTFRCKECSINIIGKYYGCKKKNNM